ncbi:hypothetical protein [Marinovum sp.]|uniref:hypothetical protein n=1 Tax=Marinovum sp. TaxID=2024839 RepID=UPI002B277ED8|nr:hypothetical protein [Marinovum sp.]
MLNLLRNPKDPGENIFNERGIPVPASRVERFLQDGPIRAILILESGESFVGALDNISYSGVADFQDGSGESAWMIDLFYLSGSSLDADSLEFSQFESHQAEALIVFNRYLNIEDVPEDVLLIFNENGTKMGIAVNLVEIMRRRLEAAESVLSLIDIQVFLRKSVTLKQI